MKIWGLDDTLVLKAIELSNSYGKRGVESDAAQPFPTYSQQHPLFSTPSDSQGRLHGMKYIDHVRWYGDFIMSKSADNKVLLWTPDAKRHAVSSVASLPQPPLFYWFSN